MLVIKVKNDGTGDAEVGHYRYEVRINTRSIAVGRIRNHTRQWGWKSLIYRLLAKEK